MCILININSLNYFIATICWWLDAVQFERRAYRVFEGEGHVKLTLLLDKPAKSDIMIQVIDTRITAIGESCTMQMNITQIVHNNEMSH